MTPDGLDALRLIYEQAASRGHITPEDLAAIMASNGDLGLQLHLTNGLDIEAVGMKGIKYEGSRYGTVFENGIVVLDLIGPIYPRANMMTSSGAVSLQQYVQDFVRAHNDPDVKGIVQNIDSPGGDARGLSDGSNMMYAYSKKRKKPVKTFVSGYMASAAYYIGATSQEIVGSKGGYVGSIGTVLKAKALATGEYEITSSQSPYKRTDPSTEEGRNIVQEFVDDVAQVMIEDIALFQGISVEKVLSDYGQGKMFAGPTAKKQGLIDSIGTLGSVVELVAREAQSGSYRQVSKRKVSAEVETLLSFTNEEIDDMGLKTLMEKFRVSSETVLGDAENKEQAQPDAVIEESDDSITAIGNEGQNTGAIGIPGMVVATREELEERFSDAAELFATQMTLKSRILPAQQAYAASDLLIAKIDDARHDGKVGYVTTEGEVAEGTREEAVRARYAAMPEHSLTRKAIAGVKDGSVVAKILSEEDKEKDDVESSDPISPERKAKLLGLTEQGQRVLAQGSNQ